MSDIIIPLPTGCSLRCGEGQFHEWGGQISICDNDGNEIVMWTAAEVEEDAENVLGAMFAMALIPQDKLLRRLNRTRVVDGCWE